MGRTNNNRTLKRKTSKKRGCKRKGTLRGGLGKRKFTETVECNEEYLGVAKSWAMFAMRTVMNDEIARNQILKKFGNIENIKYSRHFDGEHTASDPKYEDKWAEVLKFCELMQDKKPYVVFSAANIKDNKTNETHYQTFYMDNENKIVYIADPARGIDGSKPIYAAHMAEYLKEEFFEPNGYAFNYIKLKHPAQTEETDVFCQTWSLFIMLKFLQTERTADVVIDIPQMEKNNAENGEEKKLIEKHNELLKYEIILYFYKKILNSIRDIKQVLHATYKRDIASESVRKIILDNGGTDETISEILKCDPTNVILNMSAEDLELF